MKETHLTALREVYNKSEPFSVVQMTMGRVHEYVMWASDAQRMLANVLSTRTVQDLVVTPRYLQVGAVAVPAAAAQMIADEVTEFRVRLAAITEMLEARLKRWSEPATVVVPDTNIFMHHPNDWDYVPWHEVLAAHDGYEPERPVRVVILLAVIDELDRLKRSANTEEKRRRARESLRRIEQRFPGRLTKRSVLTEAEGERGAVVAEILEDELGRQRLPSIDAEIVDQARELMAIAGSAVVVLTGDTGMLVRARSVSVAAVKNDHER